MGAWDENEEMTLNEALESGKWVEQNMDFIHLFISVLLIAFLIIGIIIAVQSLRVLMVKQNMEQIRNFGIIPTIIVLGLIIGGVVTGLFIGMSGQQTITRTVGSNTEVVRGTTFI